jgi:hypothetical protein
LRTDNAKVPIPKIDAVFETVCPKTPGISLFEISLKLSLPYDVPRFTTKILILKCCKNALLLQKIETKYRGIKETAPHEH